MYQVIAQRGKLASLSETGWFVEVVLKESAFHFDDPQKLTTVIECLVFPTDAIVDGTGFARISDGNVVYVGCVMIEANPNLQSHYLTLHGEGQLTWVDEHEALEIAEDRRLVHREVTMYQGHFAHSLRNGFGTMHYSSSDVYTGEWVDGMRHGVGTLKDKEGTYFGTWYHDQKNGYGEQTYVNGQIYTGYWGANSKDFMPGWSDLGIVHRPNKVISFYQYDEELKNVNDQRIVFELIVLEHAGLCTSPSCLFGEKCAKMKQVLANKNPRGVPGLKVLLREHATRCQRQQCMMPMCCAFSVQDSHKQERLMCTKIRKAIIQG
jgi:hypothetical protein